MTNELDEPCASCGMEEHCDGWEARYCCTMCTCDMDDVPDDWCDGCDSMDI